jgi:organic radical activating enzyme
MVHYKGIRHNILNDAPFIGALIIAPSCTRGCKHCFNDHLKHNDIMYEDTAEDIIAEVKANGLNKGIILSGLEWTESPEALTQLIETALSDGLEVILYTHKTEQEFFKQFDQLNDRPIYIKFGPYIPSQTTETNRHFGVKLATDNQYIKYFG